MNVDIISSSSCLYTVSAPKTSIIIKISQDFGVAFNTSDLMNIYIALHNRGMFDPSPRSSFGTTYQILPIRLATDPREDGTRTFTAPIIEVSKTLNKRLPEKPWSVLKCAKTPGDSYKVSFNV